MVRSPDHYAAGIPWDQLDQTTRAIYSVGIDIGATALTAARRIGSSVSTIDRSAVIQRNSLDMYKPKDVPFKEFWITDAPERIFPTEPMYTITSSLALETHDGLLNEGTLLIAPVEHGFEEVDTHRGTGLALFSEFMYQLYGTTLGRKDESVWLGNKIDGEQYVLESHIAHKGPAVDQDIKEALFSEGSNGNSQLHPELERLLQALYNTKWSLDDSLSNLYETHPESKEYVDYLLRVMYENMGVRDGWYTMLESTLKHSNTDELTDSFHIGAFKHALLGSSGRPIPKASEAMIVEVDPIELYRQIPLYIFPLTSRPPGALLPAPRIPISAIRGIYTDSPNKLVLPRQLEGRQRTLEQLDPEVWLPDEYGSPVTPAQAAVRKLNPTMPLCVTRYSNDPTAEWAKHVDEGTIVPWWNDIEQPQLHDPRTMDEQVLGELVIMRGREAGLFSHLTDREVSARKSRLLTMGHMMMLIPSVRSAIDIEGDTLYTR